MKYESAGAALPKKGGERKKEEQTWKGGVARNGKKKKLGPDAMHCLIKERKVVLPCSRGGEGTTSPHRSEGKKGGEGRDTCGSLEQPIREELSRKKKEKRQDVDRYRRSLHRKKGEEGGEEPSVKACAVASCGGRALRDVGGKGGGKNDGACATVEKKKKRSDGGMHQLFPEGEKKERASAASEQEGGKEKGGLRHAPPWNSGKIEAFEEGHLTVSPKKE